MGTTHQLLSRDGHLDASREVKFIPPRCARLAAEWQLYVMHTHALRKVFLSIKGVYYQAEVFDQTITWLVPYQFTQTVRMAHP